MHTKLRIRKFILKRIRPFIRKFAPTKLSRYTVMCRIRGSVNVGFVVTIFCEYQNMTNLMLHIVYEYVQLNRVLCALHYSLVRNEAHILLNFDVARR